MRQYRSQAKNVIESLGPVQVAEFLCPSIEGLVDLGIGAVDDAASYLGMYEEETKAGLSTGDILAQPTVATWSSLAEADADHGAASTPLSSAPDQEEAKPSPSGSLAVNLKGGDIVAGGSKSFDLGALEGVLGGVANLKQGVLGGVVGLAGETPIGKLGATLKGGVDFASDGSFEALSGGVEGTLGKGKVAASGGLVATEGEVERLPNGMYQVTYKRGVGAGVEAGFGSVGATASGSHAEVGSRTFSTAEEAEAFRAELAAHVPPKKHWTAEDVAALDPGEKISTSTFADGGIEGSTLAAVGLKAGVGVQSSEGVELEKLPNGNVSVTRQSSWSLAGKAGVGCFLSGLEGNYGIGGKQDLKVEFDLEKPEVAAVFDEFQRTGQLPDELPEGVLAGKGKDVDTKDWGMTSWLGTESRETKGSTEVGTHRNGDVGGVYAKGTSSDVQKHQVLGNAVEIAAEEHAIELKGYGGNLVDMTSTSDLRGRGARARVEDLVSSDDALEQTEAEHGNTSGSYRVVTRYAGNTEGQLGQTACNTLVEQGTPLQVTEAQQQVSYDEFAVGACSPVQGLGPIADVVANGGRDGQEFIAQNVVGEQTFVEDRGTGALGGVQAHDRVEQGLSRLELADGEVDQAQLGAVINDITAQLEALHAGQANLPNPVVRLAVERLQLQHGRAAALMAAQ